MSPQKTDSGKQFSGEAAGYLLGRPGIVLMAVSLVFAAWFGQTMVAVVIGLLLGAAGLARFWSRCCLSKVTCEHDFNQFRVFPGEKITLKIRLANRKILPLPWIQVDAEMPLAFSPDCHVEADNRDGSGFLSKSTALLWYSAIKWQHELSCDKRGYFEIGPLTVTSGDIFGFYPRSRHDDRIDHIIVYPRILPVTRLTVPSIYPVGESKSDRRIFEDPTRTIGIRDYQPEDGLKRIHWKASARYQKLQSRVYEPTTTLRVALFLAVDSFPHHIARGIEDFETGISLAGSIACHLNELDSPVGLFVNTRQADSAEPVVIFAGSGVGQLVSILESLAKTTAKSSLPFEDFLQSERGALHWGTTLIFIVSRPSLTLPATLARLKESGHKVIVIQVGGDTVNHDNGIEWRDISSVVDMPASGYKESR